MYRNIFKTLSIVVIVFLNSSCINSDIQQSKYLEKVYCKTLFVGDSQTLGISHFKLLPEKNVAAKKGLSLEKAITYQDITSKLTTFKPKNVFILFGHNDINKNSKVTTFIAQYKKMLKLIKSILPKSSIYIESITPVSSSAEKKYPFVSNKDINDFNIALKNMASNEHHQYVDITRIIKASNYSYLTSDGIHLKYAFYPKLLNFLRNIINHSG